MKKINLAIVGATGMVGRTFLTVLEEKKFNKYLNNIYLYASEKNAGKIIKLFKKDKKIEFLCEKNIKNKKVDVVFFSAGEKVAKNFAPLFADLGATVIDNSSAFRMDKNVPLIVPEVNFETVTGAVNNIIANPNCSTIQCMLPLKILHDNYGIAKINFATYQAVSGSGVAGIHDLDVTLGGGAPQFYPHSIHNNALPHIGSFLENGYTSEEVKMINETQKILALNNVEISATCVRIPVKNCHSVAIDVELNSDFDVTRVREQFAAAENLIVMDQPAQNIYPLASFAVNTDAVYIGRIRRDLYNSRLLHMFCVADNLRKGAASNAVQILERLLRKADARE